MSSLLNSSQAANGPADERYRMKTVTGRILLAAVVCVSLLTGCSGSSTRILGDVNDAMLAGASPTYATTVKYVTTFYPLWFSHGQAATATSNRLVGPDRMAPVFHEVVAPNDDTLYCSSFLDLSTEPVILTIPSTKATWSLYSADAYGDVNDTGISATGLYAFVGPGWSGSLPSGATKISLPTNFSQMIVRADRFSSSGANQIAEARKFRDNLRLATLTNYNSNPSSGKPLIVPVAAYAPPFKTVADDEIAKNPVKFLGELQKAVKSSDTPPLTKTQKELSRAFDSQFNSSGRDVYALSAGARRAHSLILGDYLYHTGKTNWITLVWNDTFKTDVDRSAIAEFIQWGNGRSTAAYYQTFLDAAGNPLDGKSHRYVLTFSKSQIPQAKRFWSVTAYIPGSITLYQNGLKKYLVASYTPGLKTNKDGSISIYMAPKQPHRVPAANWLPVPAGPFNVMLRDYGPEGSTLNNAYVPPAVAPF